MIVTVLLRICCLSCHICETVRLEYTKLFYFFLYSHETWCVILKNSLMVFEKTMMRRKLLNEELHSLYFSPKYY
jgi:hypothetical protein